MKLIELLPLKGKQRQTLRRNYQILQEEVNKIGEKYEQKSYQELLNSEENNIIITIADHLEISFFVQVYNVQKDGTLCICIDANGLPTLFSIKPSYQFYKRPDGSVYY
ncbi:hypothetical protein VB715_02750 [Crocosphaera sp. UHCC 0190]|uniref:hypothetical protein n=1 Tax=Crocosphaera sp. UHCC 0190 TaxID=3110246 RepID=UPI002B1FFAD1|nr:hypothetical protein [Crocosphaera sp. UHCC 0190]MEA5508675.1 hypothetical protein [Crocosphaera sp. UHCC 0190]